ncbi:MAG: YdcF family protein [Proteobacteria bacterium]|nr:YdcF family protein [Pseudomonadota bacterium]
MSSPLIAFIKTIILPPTLNFIFIALGLLLFKKHKVLSQGLLYLGALPLVLFCFAPFSDCLLKSLEKYPALKLPVVINNEQAIVVLAAGGYPNAKEYDKDIDDAATLQRNHYAAFLYKQTNLPVLVTGGNIELIHLPESSVMTETLKNSFNVEVTWQEDKAKNTAENAIFLLQF